MDFFDDCIGAQAVQMEAYAAATNPDDLFDRLQRASVMLPIDRAAKPTKMHFATISTHEINTLQRITQVIRRGRVHALHLGSIEFHDGNDPTGGRPHYVDCTASGAVPCPIQRVFQGDRIILQYVLSPRT